MKFSIVMPVLNGARYIECALASIEVQSYNDWELIIMDGGSTDGTLDIAMAHAESDHRISVTSEPDSGMYDAVLKGFEKASGRWLAWLNSDDLYAPWCLATVAEFVEAKDCRWLTGYAGCWDENGRLRYARPGGLYPRRLIRAGWFHGGLLGCLQQESTFFSRELLGELTEEDIKRVRSMKYAGDFLLWRLFANHAPLEVLPSVLGGFRRHTANLSLANHDAYTHEVKATIPFAPPRAIAGMIATPYRLLSSWAMMRAAAHADDRLTKSAPGADHR
jgi:glycosyltransferase involved in cell wall biosynthesis